MHVDDDDDVENAVGKRKVVDVDVGHRIAEELGHFRDAALIDLPPAPFAARGAKGVVHSAVIVVPGDHQTSLVGNWSRKA